jgi:hypothetical protein
MFCQGIERQIGCERRGRVELVRTAAPAANLLMPVLALTIGEVAQFPPSQRKLYSKALPSCQQRRENVELSRGMEPGNAPRNPPDYIGVSLMTRETSNRYACHQEKQ